MKYDVEMLIKLTLDLEARESINFGFCCMLGWIVSKWFSISSWLLKLGLPSARVTLC